MDNFPSLLTGIAPPSLNVELISCVQPQAPVLNVYEDIYKNKFYKRAHLNIATKEKDGSLGVTSVPTTFKEGKPFVYEALKTTAKGYEQFEVPTSSGGSLDIEQSILKSLQRDDPGAYLIEDPGFPDEFVKIEEKHSQRRNAMKIGVVYCKPGQKTAQEMFSNVDCSPAFNNFVDTMGTSFELTNEWTKYRGDMRTPATICYFEWQTQALGIIEVVYHIAPRLTAEEHRRLLGNDIVILLFLEEDSPSQQTQLSVEQLETFGEVPQVYLVIQPVKRKFRICSITRRTITPFLPPVPRNPLTFQEVREWLLTKVYNGLCTTNYCPPMNRLFSVPRKAAIETVIEKFSKKPVSKPSTRRLETQLTERSPKLQPIRSELGLGNVTFIDTDEYNSINSLVLMVAANLAYMENSEIEQYAKEQLNISIQPAIFRDKGSEAVAVILSDDQKILISLRGPVSPEPQQLQKALASQKNQKKTKLEFKKPVVSLKGFVPALLAKPLVTLFPEMERHLQLLPRKPTFVCGHCSGGSLASLFAHLLCLCYNDSSTFSLSASSGPQTALPSAIASLPAALAQPVSANAKYIVKAIYTYGALPPGNDEWKEEYTALLGNKTHRVVQISDLIPSTILPRDQGWAHGGTLLSAGTASQNSPAAPHTIENYFTSLLPAHKLALEKLGTKNDRIVASSPEISQQINKRETLLLSLKDLEDALNIDLMDGKSNSKSGTSGRVYTGNVRPGYALPQYKATSPSKQPPPPGKGLINPDLTQQIRNNMFVLLDAFKVMRSYGLSQAGKLEFQQALGLTNMPLDNLDIIVRLLNNSVYPEVQSLESHVTQFLQEADHCLNMAASPSLVRSESDFDQKFANMLTMAKTVIEACKYV